jgi:hypothetical protein
VLIFHDQTFCLADEIYEIFVSETAGNQAYRRLGLHPLPLLSLSLMMVPPQPRVPRASGFSTDESLKDACNGMSIYLHNIGKD